MHLYYLICPDSIGLNYNPGVNLISYGTRYLIKQADPQALFIPVSNIHHSPPSWDLLFKQANCLILAGGSLYDPSDISVYWNDTIWEHISAAQAHGIPFADLWGYSSYPFPSKSIDQSAVEIIALARTERTLAVQHNAALVITRDALAHRIARTAVPDAQCLPCASFWSPAFFNIKPSSRTYNCVSVFPIVKEQWFADLLTSIARVLSREKPTFLICHTNPEYEWLTHSSPETQNIKCLYDPLSLLDLYSQCDKVISARLHAAIPAFALGCKVIYISFDSRSLALDLFGIPPVPYTLLADKALPFKYTSLAESDPPDPSRFIELFREKIVSRF